MNLTKTGGELRYSGKISSSSCPTCHTRRVTVKWHEPHLIWKIEVSTRKILIFKVKSIYIDYLTKSKDWVVRNHDYVSECSDMSTFKIVIAMS